MVEKDFDLDIQSGRVHARRWGSPEQPAVFGVSGLTANLVCFGPLAEALEGAGLQMIAHDMRGRGRSDNTAPGSYGWPAHAQDILEIADQLGIEQFDYIGWSTGSLIGLHIHKMAPQRLRRLVLLDQVAAAPQGILGVAEKVIARLGEPVPSLPIYLEAIKNMALVRPWAQVWEDYFEYEMEPYGEGLRSRTSKEAIMEDFDWDLKHDGRDLWVDVRCPVLLVRGMQSLTPDSGLVVPDDMFEDYMRAVPHTELLEVDFAHYGVGTSEKTAATVVEFLTRA